MTRLTISHLTRYSYRRAVSLDPHRLMLRPREGRLLQVTSFELTTEPASRIDWTQDASGNTVAIASFDDPVSALSIESRVKLRHAEEAWPIFPISASAISYPFAYAPDEQIDLAALRTPQFPDPEGTVATWATTFVASDPTDTLALLKDLNNGARHRIAYTVREDYGTQSPLTSLDSGQGSCRDIATLLVEAARHLGFASRLVSGYLWDPTSDQTGSSGSGSTHAWVEIFVPGAGWVTFDPTNGAVGAGHLIPVAVARTIEQIAPVSGGFRGEPSDHIDMSVSVRVTAD